MQTQYQANITQKTILDNKTMKAFLLLQRADRNIEAAKQLSEDGRFNKVVICLCRQAITCCKRAYLLHTGKVLPVNNTFTGEDMLMVISKAQHIFTKVFSVVRTERDD